jgi:uncharacterized protein (UPF0248 family)
MQPIHELLSRIRWDREFGQGRFELGYYDRQEEAIQRVGLEMVQFEENSPDSFQVLDDNGHWRRIPLHRVREVWKEGRLIWKRPG